jgi:integrase
VLTTGLRIGELVGATLGQIEVDAHGDHWLHLLGKGSKAGKVALPPLARSALDQYLMQRQLPITPARWDPKTPLIGSLEHDSTAGITATRLWSVMRRFFAKVAEVIETEAPAMAEKLRRASPHWMRHTHATHALARGRTDDGDRKRLRYLALIPFKPPSSKSNPHARTPP